LPQARPQLYLKQQNKGNKQNQQRRFLPFGSMSPTEMKIKKGEFGLIFQKK
jgi:hypothetical protein